MEIDEKIHQADDGKDHPAVGVAVWIGSVVIHSIFPELWLMALGTLSKIVLTFLLIGISFGAFSLPRFTNLQLSIPPY